MSILDAKQLICLLLVVGAVIAIPNLRTSPSSGVSSASTGKVNVFVLAGQSNMEGHGEVSTMNASTGMPLNGTLLYQLHDPRTRKEFSVLWDSKKNDWATLSDVKVWFNEAGYEGGFNGSRIPGVNGKDYSSGNLTIGFGTSGPVGNQKNFFGPELGFGFDMKENKKEIFGTNDKILIVKTAWGGKNLAVDYRPPSSTQKVDPYCRLPSCNYKKAGHFYHTMIADVRKIMRPGVIGKMYPDLRGLKAQISGFGWFQGWNDGCSLNDTAAYETNMVNLIKDLRKEWNNPNLPFSIAVSGFGGFTNDEAKRFPPDCWDGPNATKIDCDCGDQDHGCRRIDIILSQFAAANISRHPELGCCVVASETRNFWREAEYSPNKDQGYHLYHNAETHYLIGKALATGMRQAMTESKKREWIVPAHAKIQ